MSYVYVMVGKRLEMLPKLIRRWIKQYEVETLDKIKRQISP
ncbi:hypothetical protein [Nitrosomonas communis]|uniref:Transposase n=1 Tax=Nitrosomonas communis TaxID=44574 RepID=A0A1I4VJM2_9PROT|nr:hypothetical protein [Nitrosomonas communis]SFN01329.1 hypothetical protein SAMN05421863_10851 [Nitrosomonas communis]